MYADGEAMSFADGRAEDESDGGSGWRGVEVAGVGWEQVVNADEGYRDERDLGADGEVGGAVQEGLEVAVGGAAAFGENEDAEAVAQGADACAEARRAWSGGFRCRWGAGRCAEVPADEGEGPELFFGEDAELEGRLAKTTGVSM
jgi:hypothetical protein